MLIIQFGLDRRNHLAGLYRSQGRDQEAEPLLVRSLQIREQQLGADHPATASSLNNLAGLYRSQGRYQEAEPLYVRSLEIKQKTLPENHPSIQRGWDNFRYLVQQAIATGKAGELSDHPITQALLQHLQATIDPVPDDQS
jgi:tetratricopeptide (TPR) repeat protein